MARRSDRDGHQVAAVPVRLRGDGSLEILLVTSRETRRWIVPKGWPMKGLKDHRAALVEAEEEAGIDGRALARSVGSYRYWRRTRFFFRRTRVDVYAVAVRAVAKEWKEAGQRDRRWCDVLTAADSVLEPELSTILLRLPLDADVAKFLRKHARKAKGKESAIPAPDDRQGRREATSTAAR